MVQNCDGVSTKYTEILIPFRKNDQAANGSKYELHDDPLNEPLILARQALLEWIDLCKGY